MLILGSWYVSALVLIVVDGIRQMFLQRDRDEKTINTAAKITENLPAVGESDDLNYFSEVTLQYISDHNRQYLSNTKAPYISSFFNFPSNFHVDEEVNRCINWTAVIYAMFCEYLRNVMDFRREGVHWLIGYLHSQKVFHTSKFLHFNIFDHILFEVANHARTITHCEHIFNINEQICILPPLSLLDICSLSLVELHSQAFQEISRNFYTRYEALSLNHKCSFTTSRQCFPVQLPQSHSIASCIQTSQFSRGDRPQLHPSSLFHIFVRLPYSEPLAPM